MGGNRQLNRGVLLVLFLVTTLSPCVLESETFGIGEHMVLDAVFFQTRYIGIGWALEQNSSRALTPHPDTLEVLFPYNNLIACLVLIVGILSPIASWLVLTKRASFRSGFLIIVLSSILLVLAPGINTLRIEEFYTYRMHPLLVPQIASILVLLLHGRSSIYALTK